MNKYTLSGVIAAFALVCVMVYLCVLNFSASYHLSRIRGDGNSIDLYEFFMGYKDSSKVDLHLSRLQVLANIRREIYTYNFKNERPNTYADRCFTQLLSGLDIVYAQDIGGSSLRTDKLYNYYVIVWASDDIHREIEKRWIGINK